MTTVTSLSRALGHDKDFKTQADNGIKITVNLLDKEKNYLTEAQK